MLSHYHIIIQESKADLTPLFYKLLCTDDAAVCKVSGPVSEAIHAVEFETF